MPLGIRQVCPERQPENTVLLGSADKVLKHKGVSLSSFALSEYESHMELNEWMDELSNCYSCV